jgi:hypothetical protein
LSEQNITLLLPLLLILLGFGRISKRTMHLAWIIPFVFMFLNLAFPQLFFLVTPQVVSAMEAFDAQFGVARLVSRFVITVAWYVFALKLLFQLFSRPKPEDSL